MSNDLLKLPTDELLDKFGAGSHKPGSGSAAALVGLLSCKLGQTVIQLTVDREAYKEISPELRQRLHSINDKLEPYLVEAFNEDSIVFDTVIHARNTRDSAAKGSLKRKKLSKEVLNATVPATDIPLKIAEACVELAEITKFVFDHGFKSARGDSVVAISSAVSSAMGALGVVYLNLASFSGGKWAKETRDHADELLAKVTTLQRELENCINQLRTARFRFELNELRTPDLLDVQLTDRQIAEVAKGIHRKLSANRQEIWKSRQPDKPSDFFDPKKVIQLIGYEYRSDEPLGQYRKQGEEFEVAGIINQSELVVEVSPQFNPEVCRFTAAHELGHALFHRTDGLHRDRALDRAVSANRDRLEYEADRFATHFLMPEEQITKAFLQRYLEKPFRVTEETAFALGFKNESELVNQCRNQRDLSRVLASATSYNRADFPSLAERFGVSREAMAIRLEELGLVVDQA